MNVLLICPPAKYHQVKLPFQYSFLDSYFANLLRSYARRTLVGEHLGIQYLAGYLKQKGHHCTVFDACMLEYKSDQDVATHLLETYSPSDFRIVGFTGSSGVFVENCRIALALRQGGWTSHFIIGHDFCSLNHEEILSSFAVFDSIGRGEGEHLIAELAEALEQNQPLDSISGLTYRAQGQPRVNPCRPLIPDLDTLPFPERPNLQRVLEKGMSPGIVSSRGCGYNRCTFCYPNVFTSTNVLLPGGPWRARSPANLVDEIQQLQETNGVSRITFTDENFLGCGADGKDRAAMIAEEILRRKIRVNYMLNCRSVDIQPALFELLKSSGLDTVFVGLESGSQKLLDIYDKGTTVEKQARSVEILEQLGLRLVTGFIFFDPFSDFEDLHDSILFYLTLNQYDISKYSQLLRVLPGTLLCDELKKEGRVWGDMWHTDYAFSSERMKWCYRQTRALYEKLLVLLLRRVIDDRIISETQANAVIRIVEHQFLASIRHFASLPDAPYGETETASFNKPYLDDIKDVLSDHG
jgi:anaerobic magnesium-protoporphyrin IX monomethyl ester cyclase